MALCFILGSSGSGKSTYLYDMIVKKAAEQKDRQFFVLVPDQFTLETQKILVEKSGGTGILNIDVLSFQRLAFRVFEQFPALERTILEDMGKTMLLRKVFSEQKDRLTYFKKGIDKPGFLDECKSFLCELEQYGVNDEETFEQMSGLGSKFDDIRLIYESFKEKMGDTYQMAEELIVQLTSVVHEMDGIENSVICLDGFTGFTPTQYELLERLLELCDDMYVTVTTDSTKKRREVFEISEETITSLTKIANRIPIEVSEPILTGRGKEHSPYRFEPDGELSFLEKNIFCYPSGSFPKKTENIRLFVGRKPQEEAVYIASSIWWMVTKGEYRYEDIAVITKDIQTYEQALSREFGKMGIRCFIDYKKSIGANWVAEYIQSALEMYRLNMDAESTFRYLRCGLSILETSETDCLENYVLATGKRGLKTYGKEWKRNVGNLSIEEINASRQKVYDSVCGLFEQFKMASTVTEYTKALYEFLVHGDVYEKMLAQSKVFEEAGNDILAKEYRNVYKVVMNLLDEMVELMGDEPVSSEEYQTILSAGISEGLVGFVPPKKNQVVVGDVERTRLKDVKVLFFAGFSDDLVPGGQQAPGIVNTRERKRIEQMGITLAPTGTKKAARDLFYLYKAFTTPSEQLIFSYSESSSGGDGRQPSYILAKIMRIFPKMTVIREEDDSSIEKYIGTDKGLDYLIRGLTKEEYRKGDNKNIWWQLWDYYKDKEEGKLIRKAVRLNIEGKRESRLSKKALELLYSDSLYGSVTRLERFAKCPYSYFLLYGLALQEREEYTVEAPDFGNVVHYALKELSDKMQAEHIRWRDLEDETLDNLVDECVDEVTKTYRDVLFSQTKRIEFMVTRIKKMMHKTVWAISEQMRRGAFEQSGSETIFSYRDDLPSMSIDLDDGQKLLFSGIIDRIDTYEDDENVYVKVVDYKTGGVKFSLNSVYQGLQMQLVLYMAAAVELEQKHHPDKKALPAGAFYYYVKDPVIRLDASADEIDVEEDMLREFVCGGYANQSAEVLQKMDSVFGVNGRLESGVKSSCVPVATTKKGDFTANSKVAGTALLESMMRHTKSEAQNFGKRIMSGEVDASPYRMGTESGCDYCGLQGICGMEHEDLAKKSRVFEVKKEDEIWSAMNWKGGDEDGGHEVDEGTK